MTRTIKYSCYAVFKFDFREFYTQHILVQQAGIMGSLCNDANHHRKLMILDFVIGLHLNGLTLGVRGMGLVTRLQPQPMSAVWRRCAGEATT